MREADEIISLRKQRLGVNDTSHSARNVKTNSLWNPRTGTDSQVPHGQALLLKQDGT